MSNATRTLVCLWLLASSAGSNGETNTAIVSLTQGNDIGFSLSADGHIAFNLADRIWLKESQQGSATDLTGAGNFRHRPAISPGGDVIAYESVVDDFDQIFLMGTDGGDARQVTFGNYHHRSPDWSPTNGSLVMSSNRSGSFGIWELDTEELTLKQLTFSRGDEREPAWNETGSRLIYVSDTRDGNGIYEIVPGMKPKRLLTEPYEIHAPSLRPGNGVLTYVRQDGDSSQLRMLIRSTPPITKPITQTEFVVPTPVHWLNREDFIYSADGLIKRRRFGERNSTVVPFTASIRVEREIYSRRPIDLTGPQGQTVVGINGRAATPDGKVIVSALGDLWEFQTDANGRLLLSRQLTNDAYVDAHPRLSPDGQQLAFVSDRRGSMQVWVMNLESLRTSRLTNEPGIAMRPSWNSQADSITYLYAEHAAASQPLIRQVSVIDRTSTSLDAIPAATESTAKPDDEWPTLPLTWQPLISDQRYIIRAGRVFDGVGHEYRLNQEIVIDNNRIVEVRPYSSDTPSIPVIDASAFSVIPGLIDLSVEQKFVAGERVGRTWLGFGITTIREAVVDFPEAKERQESWLSGRRIGPRLLISAKICNHDDAATTDAAIAFGATGIELCDGMPEDRIREWISLAHAQGLPVTTARPLTGTLLGGDESRMLAINRGQPNDRSDFPAVTGMLGTTLITALGAGSSDRAIAPLNPHRYPQYDKLFSAAERHQYSSLGKSIRRGSSGRHLVTAVALGATIVPGSNTPMTPPGFGLHAEMQLLAKLGFQPFQILKFATLDAARALGADHQIGSIQAGKLADLVLVDGDPLADISAAGNTRIVILNGRPYGLEELTTRGARARNVGNFYSQTTAGSPILAIQDRN